MKNRFVLGLFFLFVLILLPVSIGVHNKCKAVGVASFFSPHRALVGADLCVRPPSTVGVNDDTTADQTHEHKAKIVSLAPNVTEILFAIGAGDSLVGVTDYCDEPEEAKKIPRIGGFINPNLEAILARQPDLVIAVSNGGNRAVVEKLKSLGIDVLVVKTEQMEEIYQAIETIGEKILKNHEAVGLAQRMKAQIQAIKVRVANRPRLSVALVYGHDPLVLAGKGTFADELITMAGGINIAADSTIPYPVYSFEEIIVRAPQVIIDAAMQGESMLAYGEKGEKGEKMDFSPEMEKGEKMGQKFWERWQVIPAVREGRVFGLESDAAVVPGPRLPQALAEFARLIHPEAFEFFKHFKPSKFNQKQVP